MTFTPTAEQVAIVSAARDTSDNLLVSALAGAAKTSTLVLVAKALPRVSILSIAFNKRIADEMAKQLPGNCQSMTLNSIGHRVWAQTLGRKFLTLDNRKNYRLLTDRVNELKNKEDKKAAYKVFADLLRAIEFGKTCGWVPDGHYKQSIPLMGDDEFFEMLEEEPSQLAMEIITDVTLASMAEALEGTIDFSDQLLMPTIFNSSFPQFPLVLLDEAQDLSALNHRMLSKFARKRLIAVGDECQSIYGFRGAHEDSMQLLKQSFSMKEFLLTISFRCPQSVVEEARWRAPHMRFPDWAIPGSVKTPSSWGVEDLPPDAVILCRNNAPLFNLAITLLRRGRYPELVGSDIGKTLIKWLKSLGEENLPQEGVLQAIEEWAEEKLAKSRNPDSVHDQASCMRIFAEQGATLGAAILYAERVLASAGPVKLMTGHKSKGLEFPNVFILDRQLVGKSPQNRNLLYVMQTRAKETLTYITTEGLEDA